MAANPVGPSGNWQLIFEDTFSTINTSVWDHKYINGDIHDDEQTQYVAANQVPGPDGVHLLVKKETAPDGRSYTGGMICSYPGLNVAPPAYFEAKIKMPGGVGSWPAFWLLNANRYPPEIDILEILNNDTVDNLHYHGAINYNAWAGEYDMGTAPSAGFHVYGFNYKGGSAGMEWWVDGKLVGSTNADPINDALYITINNTVGANGSYSGPPDSSSVFPTDMTVAYVRVWTPSSTPPLPPPPPPASGPCPAGFNCADIGSPALTGSQAEDSTGENLMVTAGGVDIWNTSDQFRYVSQPFTGDGSVSARVASQTAADAWSKAGVMFRQSSDPASAYYGVFVTPTSSHGIVVQYRNPGGASAQGPTTVVGGAPKFLKIVRTGNTFTAYTSPDGNAATWSQIPNSTVTIPMTDPIEAGLAVTGHNASAYSTAVFDSTQITGANPPPLPPPPAKQTVLVLSWDTLIKALSVKDGNGNTIGTYTLE